MIRGNSWFMLHQASIMSRLIQVLPYNPHWPIDFQQEAANLIQALGDNCITIHHIGSTSVPGLAAKPIIDIIPVVRDIAKVADKALIALGYVPRGEMGMPFRGFYNKGEPRTHHLHIWEDGNPEIEKHLLFRDYLRAHPDYAARYADLKLKLAAEFSQDRKNYTEAKDALIKQIMQQAGFSGLTVVQTNLPAEWNAAKRFRQKYFLADEGIADPYTWTFGHADHLHFVLYHGTEFIGYSHVQLWPDAKATIHLMIVDDKKHNNGFAAKFLAVIDRWLQSRDYGKIERKING